MFSYKPDEDSDLIQILDEIDASLEDLEPIHASSIKTDSIASKPQETTPRISGVATGVRVAESAAVNQGQTVVIDDIDDFDL